MSEVLTDADLSGAVRIHAAGSNLTISARGSWNLFIFNTEVLDYLARSFIVVIEHGFGETDIFGFGRGR